MTAKKTAEKKPADKPAPASKEPVLSKQDLEVMSTPEWQAARAGVVVVSED